MVHALEEIQRLLKPKGCLIDIHPIREAPFIKVYRKQEILFEASDPGYDYDEDLQHADEALAEVIGRGLYHIEGQTEFEVITSASSVVEMREYWATYGAFEIEPKDEAIVARLNEVYDKANAVMQKTSDAEIAYHERARMMRLNPAGNFARL